MFSWTDRTHHVHLKEKVWWIVWHPNPHLPLKHDQQLRQHHLLRHRHVVNGQYVPFLISAGVHTCVGSITVRSMSEIQRSRRWQNSDVEVREKSTGFHFCFIFSKTLVINCLHKCMQLHTCAYTGLCFM